MTAHSLCSLLPEIPPNHLTFSAPDCHGQSVFNPPPCGVYQVTTPVRRAQESLAQHGERRRRLYYQQGKANRQPPQPDRIGQIRLKWATTGDLLTTAAGSLRQEVHESLATT